MSEKKDFKDYSMIKFLAKMNRAQKGDITKDCIYITWPFGDALFELRFDFSEKRCTNVLILFDEIYEKYGKNIASSYNEFVEKFVERYNFYTIVDLEGDNAISSDVSENRIEHSASQAFTNLSVFIKVMNEFVGYHEEEYSEKDIREFHQTYLAYQYRKMIYSMYASVASFVLGIVFVILAVAVVKVNFVSACMIYLGVPLIVCGFIAFFFFMARRKFYSATLVKAQRNRT